jgi:hypothetical protein
LTRGRRLGLFGWLDVSFEIWLERSGTVTKPNYVLSARLLRGDAIFCLPFVWVNVLWSRIFTGISVVASGLEWPAAWVRVDVAFLPWRRRLAVVVCLDVVF